MSDTNKPDTKIITPTIGRRVWYHPDPRWGQTGFVCHDQTVPMDAGIVYVWGDRMVNLDVCDHAGNHHAFTSVELVQPGDKIPIDARYCEWMPYQVGQAAKTEPAQAQQPAIIPGTVVRLKSGGPQMIAIDNGELAWFTAEPERRIMRDRLPADALEIISAPTPIKVYADGTVATGPGQLPDQSPAEQGIRRDVDLLDVAVRSDTRNEDVIRVDDPAACLGRGEPMFFDTKKQPVGEGITATDAPAVTRSHVCGVSCKPGGVNCNNYCNHDPKTPMPDSPAKYSLALLKFGHALELLKAGAKVARLGWNGKGMYLWLNLGSHDKHEQNSFVDGVSRALFTLGDDGTVTRMPNINMRAASGATVTGWLASQTDMLAEDWVVVE